MRKTKRQRDDYTEEELRTILCDRFRFARQERLKEFHRSGKTRSQGHRLTPVRSPTNRSGSQFRKEPFLFGNFLKVIEAGLLLGLMLLGLSGWRMLGNLNQQTRSIWQIPAVTPTALITPIILPSGHTQSAIPVNYYSKIPNVHGVEGSIERSIPITINPASEPEFAIRIVIPSIDVDAPIVLGVESEQLKKGVGQVPGSANPGQKGNMVLSAHNDIYGELFRYLDQLKPGEQFTVYSNVQAYTYSIIGWELVEPTRVDILAPTPDATATLISCYPYLIDTMRIIVRAQLVDG